MSTKLRFLVLFAVVAGVLVISTIVMASEYIKPLNPSSGEIGIVPPLLAPPDSEGYTRSDTAITSPDGRPFAQLAKLPPELGGALFVNFPAIEQPSDDEVAYSILASVKYIGEKFTILVTTSRPSPAASSQAVILGNQEIKLANGVTAWATIGAKGDFPNRVVFVQDNLIITVAGNMPISEIQKLAARVVVK